MRNLIGPSVGADDFFDREAELREFRRLLDNDANILLSAPRRVGKTSLATRMAEEWRKASHRKAVYFSAESCGSELDFVDSLVNHLGEVGLNAGWWKGTVASFRRLKGELAGIKVGVGIDFEVGGVSDLQHTSLKSLVAHILKRIEDSDDTVLIVVDELPEMLAAMQKQEQGIRRVEQLLHWLRELRQTFRKRVRWLLLGSVGLDSFVELRNLGATINDLTPQSLGAFSDDVADAFLKKLGADNALLLPEDVRREIIKQLGWPLPYHLQLVFHAFLALNERPATPASVDRAVGYLLRPENNSVYFDTWRQRLREQLGPDDLRIVQLALKQLCDKPQGLSRNKLLDSVMVVSPVANSLDVDQRLGDLLKMLERDGYLLRGDNGHYAFRSFLLREYWHRREN
jgi:uncharacterized protein